MVQLRRYEPEPMDTNPASRPSGEPIAAHNNRGKQKVIQIEHASVRRNRRLLWSDLNLTLQQGEFIAILGPNGAGKSTLLKTLLGLLPLYEGRITILGSPVRRGHPAISYLPQRRNFGAHVRVRGRDIVRLGLDGAQWGIPLPLVRRLWKGDVRERELQRTVQKAIDLVGATAYANRPIGEISGGEQQRLLIAQALVTKPRILLLDEPLDSLDLYNQQSISALIRYISQEHQVTVLLVAHDVNPILPYLDRVLYIGGGQSVVGTPQEVITSETLSRLYNAPIDVLRTRDGRIVVVGQPESVTYHAHFHNHSH